MSDPHLALVADEITQMHMGQHWPAKEWLVTARPVGVGFDPPSLTLGDGRVGLEYVIVAHVPDFMAHEVCRRWVVGNPVPEQRWKLIRPPGPDSKLRAEPWER